MPISFPVAIHGSEAHVKKRIIAASRAWANDLRNGVPLRELESRAVPRGTPIYCSEVTSLQPGQPRWRLYGLGLVPGEVGSALDWKDGERTRAALEAELLRFPAGVMWLNVGWPAPNTRAIIQTRVDALLGCWDELARLSYVDDQLQPQPLEVVIAAHYEPFLGIWLDDPTTGPLAERLQAAVAVAMAASEDDARQRLIAAMVRVAHGWRRIPSPERFLDRAWVERRLAAVDPSEYESAKTGATLADLVYMIYREEDDQDA